jgi:hypothetical protein
MRNSFLLFRATCQAARSGKTTSPPPPEYNGRVQRPVLLLFTLFHRICVAAALHFVY